MNHAKYNIVSERSKFSLISCIPAVQLFRVHAYEFFEILQPSTPTTDIALLFSDTPWTIQERHWFNRPQRLFFSTFLDLLMTILARLALKEGGHHGVPWCLQKPNVQRPKPIKTPEWDIEHLSGTYFDTVHVSIDLLSCEDRPKLSKILLVLFQPLWISRQRGSTAVSYWFSAGDRQGTDNPQPASSFFVHEQDTQALNNIWTVLMSITVSQVCFRRCWNSSVISKWSKCALAQFGHWRWRLDVT